MSICKRRWGHRACCGSRRSRSQGLAAAAAATATASALACGRHGPAADAVLPPSSTFGAHRARAYGRADAQRLVGAVKLRTPQAQRALAAFVAEVASSPSSPTDEGVTKFDSALRKELRALRRQLREREASSAARGCGGDSEVKSDLRRRVRQVRRASHARATAELLHLRICNGLWRLGLGMPLSQALAGAAVDANRRGEVLRLDGEFDPRLATSIHSSEALGLVREHLRSTLGNWEHLTRDLPVQVALGRLRETYVASAEFGFRLRRADVRLNLERIAKDASSASTASAPPRPVPSGGSPKPFDPAEVSADPTQDPVPPLRMYMARLSLHEDESGVVAAPVLEAQLALERQATALFGRADSVDVESESARMTVSDLRRLALEAVAFGSLLYDAERCVDAIYELGCGEEGLTLQELADGGDAAVDDEWDPPPPSGDAAQAGASGQVAPGGTGADPSSDGVDTRFSSGPGPESSGPL